MNQTLNIDTLMQFGPFIVMLIAPVILMIIVALKRNHMITWIYTLVTLLVTMILAAAGGEQETMFDLFTIDKFTLFYTILFSAAGFMIALSCYSYFEKSEEQKEEFYILLVFAILGSSMLVASNHFVSLFISLEVLSISLYSLIGYFKKTPGGIEAAIKYLVLAAMSSAVMIFGMALIYLETGTMEFSLMGNRLSSAGMSPWILGGMALLTAGAGFKLSVAPFHWWTPDVYQGASSPVTSLVATISKGGMLGALIRLFMAVNGLEYPSMVLAIGIIAILSMFTGNILALLQTNVKRILAYSSISHLGYILIAFLAGKQHGTEAATFYLVAYFATTIGAFAVITVLATAAGEPEEINEYKGLFYRNPWLAAFFSLIMFSLAGIPLTAGFVGKFYIAAAGVDVGLWTLLIVLAVNSVIGVFYYLRVVATMFSKQDESKGMEVRPMLISAGGITLFIIAAVILWVGVSPSWLIRVIEGVAGF
ncbi:MAG TPA: NADH-quinone oxidoreductase subunit N [Cyclobacteriaceae bacterium]|nr:NADH-quinone oxidoreductase subunit N [Cyclobacteriaceae bacterium]